MISQEAKAKNKKNLKKQRKKGKNTTKEVKKSIGDTKLGTIVNKLVN
jgi:hypothetical protein